MAGNFFVFPACWINKEFVCRLLFALTLCGVLTLSASAEVDKTRESSKPNATTGGIDDEYAYYRNGSRVLLERIAKDAKGNVFRREYIFFVDGCNVGDLMAYYPIKLRTTNQKRIIQDLGAGITLSGGCLNIPTDIATQIQHVPELFPNEVLFVVSKLKDKKYVVFEGFAISNDYRVRPLSEANLEKLRSYSIRRVLSTEPSSKY